MNQPYEPMQPNMAYPLQQPMAAQPPQQPVYPIASMPFSAPTYQTAFPQGPYPYPAGRYSIDMVSPNTNPMPWAGPYQDPAMGTEEDESLLTKKVGGLPVWGWAVAGLVVVGGGFAAYKYFVQKSDQSTPSTSEPSDESGEDLQENESSSSEWTCSRSGFGREIDKFFKLNRIRGVKVYIDADEAAKTIKCPSPLITMRVPKSTALQSNPSLALHNNPAFVALCANEGLKPIETADGILGLYPDGVSERGRLWENYTDALREDGQGV